MVSQLLILPDVHLDMRKKMKSRGEEVVECNVQSERHLDGKWYFSLYLHDEKVPEGFSVLCKDKSLSFFAWAHVGSKGDLDEYNLKPGKFDIFKHEFNGFEGTADTEIIPLIGYKFIIPTRDWGKVKEQDWFFPVSVWRDDKEIPRSFGNFCPSAEFVEGEEGLVVSGEYG